MVWLAIDSNKRDPLINWCLYLHLGCGEGMYLNKRNSSPYSFTAWQGEWDYTYAPATSLGKRLL